MKPVKMVKMFQKWTSQNLETQQSIEQMTVTCICAPWWRHRLHSGHWTCFDSACLIIHNSTIQCPWYRRNSFSLHRFTTTTLPAARDISQILRYLSL